MYGATRKGVAEEAQCDSGIDSDLNELTRNIANFSSSKSHEQWKGIKCVRRRVKQKISHEQDRQIQLLQENKKRCRPMSAQQQTDAHRLSSYMSTLNTLMDEEKALISESFHQSEAQGEKEQIDFPSESLLLPIAANAEGTATEMENLQRDIKDLHQIYKDLSLLVNEQGGTVKTIESEVSRAQIYVHRANEKLRDTVPLKRSYWRKKCYILSCVVVTVTAVVIILVVIVLVLHYLKKF